MSFSVGDVCFVGKSNYPAKIVALLANEYVQVEWLGGTCTNYECIHALSSIQPSTRQRKRVQTTRYTQDTVKKEEDDEEEEKKSTRGDKRRSSQRASTRRSNATNSTRSKKQSQVKKSLAAKQKSPSKKSRASKRVARKPPPAAARKPPPPAARKPPQSARRRITASNTTTTRHDYSRLNGVAKRPEPGGDSSSDEELLAEARRLSQQHDQSTSIMELDSTSEEDDRKPAAKSSSTTTFSSDSSDDELYLQRLVAKGRSTANKRKKGQCRKRRRSQARALEDSDIFERDDSDDGESSVDAAPKRSSRRAAVKKEESESALQAQEFHVGAHVWIQDGVKHAAQIVALLPNDMLQVKWSSSGYIEKKPIPASVASHMFDLTNENAGERPKRSRRATRKPEHFTVDASIEKEPSPRRRTSRVKKEESRVTIPKKKPPVRTTRRKSRSIIDSDLDTTGGDESSDIESTSAVDSVVMIDSSSDLDSDSDTVDTEATFEYTAPGVDPKYRSLHPVRYLDSFRKMKPWSIQTPEQEKQKARGAAEVHVGGSKVYDVEAVSEFSASPKLNGNATRTMREKEIDHAVSGEGSSILQDASPSRLDNECNKKDGDDPHSVASLPNSARNDVAAAMTLDDTNDDHHLHRQSTETANPEELPDIFLESDAEATANGEERRLTADSQELKAFTAFGGISETTLV